LPDGSGAFKHAWVMVRQKYRKWHRERHTWIKFLPSALVTRG
jgi:hypothetical protein